MVYARAHTRDREGRVAKTVDEGERINQSRSCVSYTQRGCNKKGRRCHGVCLLCVSVAIATTPMPVKVDTTNHLVRRDRVAQIATQSRREDIPIVTRASHDNPAR